MVFAKTCFAGDIIVMRAAAMEPVVATAKTAMATFALTNQGSEPDHLISVEASVAKFADIHQTIEEGGVVKMRPVERLEIAAGATADLADMHMHVMLTGLQKPLQKGDIFDMTLRFERAGVVAVKVLVGDGMTMGDGSTP